MLMPAHFLTSALGFEVLNILSHSACMVIVLSEQNFEVGVEENVLNGGPREGCKREISPPYRVLKKFVLWKI